MNFSLYRAKDNKWFEMKRNINSDGTSNKKTKLDDTQKNDNDSTPKNDNTPNYDNIIRLIGKWYRRYKLINSTTFIGKPFKSIPLKYLTSFTNDSIGFGVEPNRNPNNITTDNNIIVRFFPILLFGKI